MKRKRTARLNLEALEDRFCPSLVIQSISGELLISGTPTGTTGFTITGMAGGKYQVMDGASNKGTFTASTILLNLQNQGNESLTVNLNGQTLPGNLQLSLGLGNLSTTPSSNPVTVENGTVGGSVTVITSSTNETVQMGMAGASDPVAIGGAVQVVGPTGSLGQVYLYNGSSIGGAFTVTDMPSVQIGEIGPPNGGATIGGAVSVNDSRAGTVLDLTVNGTSTLKNGLSAVGTPLSTGLGDLFDMSGPSAGVFPTINGNVNVNLGDGLNFWDVGGTINGNTTFTGGNGNSPFAGVPENEIELGDGINPATIHGAFQATTGGGSTALVFNAGSAVYGNMSLNFGNGTNDLGGGTLGGVFQGSLFGNLNITLGNGSNTALIETAPTGKLTWTSGNGTDALTLGSTLTPSSVWEVDMHFGSGTNTLTLAHTGNPPQILTGLIDGDGGTNSISQDTDWVLINLSIYDF